MLEDIRDYGNQGASTNRMTLERKGYAIFQKKDQECVIIWEQVAMEECPCS